MPQYGNVRRNKRDVIEILHDILDCVYELQLRNRLRPVPKTNVMQCSNLNTNSFRRHLEMLLSNGLVVVEPLSGRLLITVQGLLFKRMASKLFEKLQLGNSKPILVSLGSQAFTMLAGQRPELIMQSNGTRLLPVLLEICDYIIAVSADRAACLAERSKRIMLICCEGHNCRVVLEASSVEQLKLDDVIRATASCIEGG